MDSSGVLTAICRVAAVLAVAGVIAMHGLTTGHHAELPGVGGVTGAAGHSSMTANAVTADRAMGGAPSTEPSGGPTLPERIVEICMAILLVAATTLLLLHARMRHRLWPWPAASTSPPRWTLHVPRPRAPSLFTLGVLRM